MFVFLSTFSPEVHFVCKCLIPACRIDILGSALLAGALCFEIIAFLFGGSLYPWGSGVTIGSFYCSSIFWIVFGISKLPLCSQPKIVAYSPFPSCNRDKCGSLSSKPAALLARCSSLSIIYHCTFSSCEGNQHRGQQSPFFNFCSPQFSQCWFLDV